MDYSKQKLKLSGASDNFILLTNVTSLTPSTTFLYDKLWKKRCVDEEPMKFIQHCQKLCYGKRFRTNVFNVLLSGMTMWPEWKKVSLI